MSEDRPSIADECRLSQEYRFETPEGVVRIVWRTGHNFAMILPCGSEVDISSFVLSVERWVLGRHSLDIGEWQRISQARAKARFQFEDARDAAAKLTKALSEILASKEISDE